MTRQHARARREPARSSSPAALVLTGCGGSGFDDTGDAGGGDERRTHVVGRRAHHPDRLQRRGRDGGGRRGRRRLVGGVRRRGDRLRSRTTSTSSCRRASRRARRRTCSTCRPTAIAGYAGNGSLSAYGDELENKDDFYPSLVENFTVDGEFYCAPKDFSTLALIINTDLWAAAGLTEADIPTTWDELAAVSADAHHRRPRRTGVRRRVPARRHVHGAGGRRTGRRRRKPWPNSPENVEALDYVKYAPRTTAPSPTPPTSAPAGAARRSASSWPRW